MRIALVTVASFDENRDGEWRDNTSTVGALVRKANETEDAFRARCNAYVTDHNGPGPRSRYSAVYQWEELSSLDTSEQDGS